MESAMIYNEVIAEKEVKLSTKGQLIIVAEARAYLEKRDIWKFNEKVYRNGTIVLTPIDERSDEEKFVSSVKEFQEEYGVICY